jgi:hypothetical protein
VFGPARFAEDGIEIEAPGMTIFNYIRFTISLLGTTLSFHHQTTTAFKDTQSIFTLTQLPYTIFKIPKHFRTTTT